MVFLLKIGLFSGLLVCFDFTIFLLELNHTLSRLTSCQFCKWLLHLSTTLSLKTENTALQQCLSWFILSELQTSSTI